MCLYDDMVRKSIKGAEIMITQQEKVLNVLKVKDTSVRELLVEHWINSPTKILSELRRAGHKITDYRDSKNKRIQYYHLEA